MECSAGVLISCEVGGDRIPPPLKERADSDRMKREPTREDGKLTTDTRLHDDAAVYVSERMAHRLDANLVANPFANDLIDVARSPHNRYLFSPMTRKWPLELRREMIDLVYEPYRDRLRGEIKKLLARSSYVLHISVRTFPLKKRGKVLRTDMGLLYDPSIDDEVDLCLDWIDEMYDELPMLRVRRNYPRRGTCDGITRAMRNEFADQNYLGIELMLNRAWVGRPVAIRDEVIDGICGTLRLVVQTTQSDAA